MFIPFALRVLKDESVGQRKLKAGEVYYLSQGFEITQGGLIHIDKCRREKDNLYNDYFQGNDNTYPDISISAIVGENGSGKSSLIELILRLLNNFSAATIGEFPTNTNTEHLHFINGIYAELFYLKGKTPYRLKVEDRHVSLEDYKYDCIDKANNRIRFIRHDTPNIFDNKSQADEQGQDRISPMTAWKPQNISTKISKQNPLSGIYKHLFYTHVSNYSIYAYNSDDYSSECNSENYEAQIRRTKRRDYSCEDRNWLTGIFHKNDGYQTPIVLSPMRTRGDIDINTENELVREGLTSLLIAPNSCFRTINGHLLVTGIELNCDTSRYNIKHLKSNVGFRRLQQQGYKKFEQLITRYWGNAIGLDLTKNESQRKYHKAAIGYLVYKTLKISRNYRPYNSFFKSHDNIAYRVNEKKLEELIERLSQDRTHITRKIRRTLAYIVYGIYEPKESEITGTFRVSLDETGKEIDRILHKENNIPEISIRKRFLYSIEDLVPPPFYDMNIRLEEQDTGHPVLFETLSSGERQQTYSISSILYHLSNLESVWADDNQQRIAYDTINIILEEIELYFHPDLQRTFIKNLLDGLRQCRLEHIRSIHFCLVTHSPFVLSDIPGKNILTLDKDGRQHFGQSGPLPSFGANIHEMLYRQFFLCEGAVGAYARWVIDDIIEKMEKAKSNQKDTECAAEIHKRILLIDEPIVRNALLNEYHAVFTHEDRVRKIAELERQIRDLKREHKLCGN